MYNKSHIQFQQKTQADRPRYLSRKLPKKLLDISLKFMYVWEKYKFEMEDLWISRGSNCNAHKGNWPIISIKYQAGNTKLLYIKRMDNEYIAEILSLFVCVGAICGHWVKLYERNNNWFGGFSNAKPKGAIS